MFATSVALAVLLTTQVSFFATFEDLEHGTIHALRVPFSSMRNCLDFEKKFQEKSDKGDFGLSILISETWCEEDEEPAESET
jgi:hypothetical protein